MVKLGIPKNERDFLQRVETVEKVPFQKLFLKSGREMLNSTWFWVQRTTFWQHFSYF
jgi:hypothetical protein